MPRRFRLAWKGWVCGCSEGWKSRNSIAKGWPFGSFEHAALALAAGLAQELVRAAQEAPVLARAVGDGRHDGLAEDGSRKLVRGTARAAPASSGEGLPTAFMSVFSKYDVVRLNRAEHDVRVRPFEIEGEPDGLADARILEGLAARVEVPALDRGRRVVRDLLLLHPALAHGREIVAGRPDARRVFLVEVERAVLERLEGHGAVAEILVADAVEIVLAHIHRQVLGPVIRHALELDEAPGLEAADLVGAGAERRLQGRGLEIACPASSARRRSACRRRRDAGRGCAAARTARAGRRRLPPPPRPSASGSSGRSDGPSPSGCSARTPRPSPSASSRRGSALPGAG